jgi:hypothetical protein
MITDNWPVDFIYISRRIVKEIVQQHEAGRSDRGLKVSLTGSIPIGPVSPGVSVESSSRSVDYTNYYELAKRATAAVSDHTGWLAGDKPDRIPTGPYVRAKIFLQAQKVSLPLTVWEKRYNHPIAIFAGTETVPGVGRVFVGLAGSALNFLHVHGGGPSMATRTPSDAVGIYDIIQQSRELTKEGILEPGISASHLDREAFYCYDEETRFQEALGLFDGCGLWKPSSLLEMLIRVHHVGTDIDLNVYTSDGYKVKPFDLVLLGAPVWVSTLEPQRDEIVLPSRRSRRELSKLSDSEAFWDMQIKPANAQNLLGLRGRLVKKRQGNSSCPDTSSLKMHQASALRRTPSWTVFDAQLDAYLAAVSQGWTTRGSTLQIVLTQWPPSKAQWREFGEWFVDIACRLGPDPRPFQVPLGKSQLSGERVKRSHRPGKRAVRYGWLIKSVPRSDASLPDYDDYDLIVLLDGTAWTTFDKALPRDKRRFRPVRHRGFEKEAAAASIFRTIALWRTPMTNDDQVPVIDIASGGEPTSGQNPG